MTRYALDPEKLAPAIEEAYPVGDGQPPVACDGWYDRAGRPRRVRADYANGWRVELRLSEKGKITSSSASIRLTTKKVAG